MSNPNRKRNNDQEFNGLGFTFADPEHFEDADKPLRNREWRRNHKRKDRRDNEE